MSELKSFTSACQLFFPGKFWGAKTPKTKTEPSKRKQLLHEPSVSDWRQEEFYPAVSDGSAPITGSSCSAHTTRAPPAAQLTSLQILPPGFWSWLQQMIYNEHLRMCFPPSLKYYFYTSWREGRKWTRGVRRYKDLKSVRKKKKKFPAGSSNSITAKEHEDTTFHIWTSCPVCVFFLISQQKNSVMPS